MNCTDITNNIDDYIDGQLDHADTLAFEAHLSNCSDCQDRLENSQRMLSELKMIDVPAASKNFEQRVFAEVRRQHSHKTQYKFAAGFSTAIAASFALWFTASTFFTEPLVEEPLMVSISLHEVRTVRLMIDADMAINQAQLNISLPANLRIDGYPENTELSWQTDLSEGQNILSLPLIALEHGQGELVAKLNYGSKTKEFRLSLKTSADGALQYQLHEMKSA